ncbi:hypothetical protein MRB53_040664 [Persea americana]|nr:hypothetical protein MRB53_040664 [Persea americana]
MAFPAPTAAPFIARHQIQMQLQDEKWQTPDGTSNDAIAIGPFHPNSNEEIAELRKELGAGGQDLFNGRTLASSRSRLRKEEKGKMVMFKRQTSAEQACFVGNNRLSCYPSDGMRFEQGTWGKDNDTVVTQWTGIPNTQRRLSFQPQDSWWQGSDAADNFNGTNIDWPFYFVITYNGRGLGGATTRLSTWYGVQTALPVRVAESRSAMSASISSASLASAASAASKSAATVTGSAASALSSSRAAQSASFAASVTSALVSSLTAQGLHGTQTLQSTATATLTDGLVVTATATGRADGFVFPPMQNSSSNDLPGYAIALIAVFGFLVLLAALFGLYFILVAARKRRKRHENEADMQSISKMGSTTPMIRTSGDYAYRDEPTSPVGTSDGAALERSADIERNQQQDLPFSHNEASRMADAFRAALREPSFTNNDASDELARRKTLISINEEDPSPAALLMRDELKAGGQDLRQVQERRKPEIHE